MKPTLAESIYIRSTIKFLNFVPFRQQIWPPRVILVSDWLMLTKSSPIKEAPPRSGKPVHRTQSLESEDLEMEIMGQSYDTINEEDDQAGPLIPPPKGFGSPSKPPPGRPLSHSIPQVGR